MTQPTLFDAPPVAEFQRLCKRKGVTLYAPEFAKAILLYLQGWARDHGQPCAWSDIMRGLAKMEPGALGAKLARAAGKVDWVTETVVDVSDVPF